MIKSILNAYLVWRHKHTDQVLPVTKELQVAANLAATHPEHVLRLATVMASAYNREQRNNKSKA